ncbi:hypothetical protein ASPWEDRAFT_504059 [Aspergillus wentii DTO 134E9]|uniref:Transmembrane protein n=1 Tax=Aspergillus wentii DTO 134E9 TaxID=1073089 RepID=A0A1L9RK24_ASPWE|nr:uncharacterized protein ASPWEDRAFT_504059 [Aspergillus wentii DTO 134E9]OJJ35289.1 hypothetical protein ASPWEDRAFT_504059 [Aspergillus wentii DTO 134E9]
MATATAVRGRLTLCGLARPSPHRSGSCPSIRSKLLVLFSSRPPVRSSSSSFLVFFLFYPLFPFYFLLFYVLHFTSFSFQLSCALTVAHLLASGRVCDFPFQLFLLFRLFSLYCCSSSFFSSFRPRPSTLSVGHLPAITLLFHPISPLGLRLSKAVFLSPLHSTLCHETLSTLLLRLFFQSRRPSFPL